MAKVVYLMCAVASLSCCGLLLKTYYRSGVKLLFWAGISFLAMSINNVMLFIDLIIVPNVDLSVYRLVIALIGVVLLIKGLIWEAI